MASRNRGRAERSRPAGGTPTKEFLEHALRRLGDVLQPRLEFAFPRASRALSRFACLLDFGNTLSLTIRT